MTVFVLEALYISCVFLLSIYLHHSRAWTGNLQVYGYCTSFFFFDFRVCNPLSCKNVLYFYSAWKLLLLLRATCLVYGICDATTSNLSGCTEVRGFDEEIINFLAPSRRKLLDSPEKVLKCHPLSKVIW